MVCLRKSNRWHRPDDRGGHLVGLRGRQDEADARRRFLEHLQQRIERLAGEPLRLVDDVDLLAALHRRRRRLLAELPRVLDATVGRRIDLHHVQVRPLADGHALFAATARLGRRARGAVDHLGQDPRGGRLAGPAGTAEQERVMEAAVTDGAGERPHDMILTEHLGRRLGPVPPVERLVLPVLRHLPRSSPL